MLKNRGHDQRIVIVKSLVISFAHLLIQAFKLCKHALDNCFIEYPYEGLGAVIPSFKAMLVQYTIRMQTFPMHVIPRLISLFQNTRQHSLVE